jgi:hypothetical protein
MSYAPTTFLHAPFSYTTNTVSPSPDGMGVLGGMNVNGMDMGGGGIGDATPSPTPSMMHDFARTPSPDVDSTDPAYRTVRLPPILQVEKRLVTTTATQTASAIRRKNDALFKCPVPGCGSTFTRRFNLRGTLIQFCSSSSLDPITLSLHNLIVLLFPFIRLPRERHLLPFFGG